MGRTLKQALDALPPERRVEIDQRFDELVNEIEASKRQPRSPRKVKAGIER
jgi:hypothetical protein